MTGNCLAGLAGGLVCRVEVRFSIVCIRHDAPGRDVADECEC